MTLSQNLFSVKNAVFHQIHNFSVISINCEGVM